MVQGAILQAHEETLNQRFRHTERYRVGLSQDDITALNMEYLAPLPPKCATCGAPTEKAVNRTCHYCQGKL